MSARSATTGPGFEPVLSHHGNLPKPFGEVKNNPPHPAILDEKVGATTHYKERVPPITGKMEDGSYIFHIRRRSKHIGITPHTE